MIYEVVYILSPKLQDAEVEKTRAEITAFLNSQGKVVKEDVWGKKKFIYEIQHFESGFYVLIEFEAEPAKAVEIGKQLKLKEEILRFLIVRKEELGLVRRKNKEGKEVKVAGKAKSEMDAEKKAKEVKEEKVEENHPAPACADKGEKTEKKEEAKPKSDLEELDKKIDEILGGA